MDIMDSINILVIGDIMLDTYYHGSANRISPEAPVPVVKINTIKQYPGGAGNVVNNLSGIGVITKIVAGIGSDDSGEWLQRYYKKKNIDFVPIVLDKPTITKSRVLGGRQQVLRFDQEDTSPLSREDEGNVLSILEHLDCSRFQAIIISDYNKGFCTESICRSIINFAKAGNIPVFVDPKGDDWEKYSGAFMVTPNLSELSAVSGEEVQNTHEHILKLAERIRDEYNLVNILVTRSEMGMTLISDKGVNHMAAEAREVYDVSGAGDTVIATVAYLIAHGLDCIEAAKLANLAAGIAVSHSGTWAIDRSTITTLLNRHFYGRDDASSLAESIRVQGKRIVFTNGCFDVLHKGHVDYLRKTAELGDILIVGVNSDDSVKRLKGPQRPINAQDARAEVLGALAFVDYVVIFDEDTPYNLIKAIKPDVLTKGGDYSPETVVGREFAGKTVIIPLTPGFSTTNTIERMNSNVR